MYASHTFYSCNQNKVLLNQQKLSWPNKFFRLNMDQWEICLNYQKNIVDFFYAIPTKNFCIVSKKKKKMEFQNHCRIKETDFVNSSKI